MSRYNKRMVMLCAAAFCTNFMEWGYLRIIITSLILYGIYYFHNKYKDDEISYDDNYMRLSGSYYDDATTIINKYLNSYKVIVVYYRNYNKTFICRKDEDGSIWQREIDAISPKQKHFVPEFPMDDLIIYRPKDKKDPISYNTNQGEGGSGGGANVVYSYNIATANASCYNPINTSSYNYLSKDELTRILKIYESDPLKKEKIEKVLNDASRYYNLGNNNSKEEK